MWLVAAPQERDLPNLHQHVGCHDRDVRVARHRTPLPSWQGWYMPPAPFTCLLQMLFHIYTDFKALDCVPILYSLSGRLRRLPSACYRRRCALLTFFFLFFLLCLFATSRDLCTHKQTSAAGGKNESKAGVSRFRFVARPGAKPQQNSR